MPDIVSDRPVSGAAIASSWGDEVHDAIEGIQAAVAPDISLPGTAGSVAQAAVVFPRPYASPPVVVVSNGGTNAGASGGEAFMAMGYLVTTTGFTIRLTRIAGSSTSLCTVRWIAVGTPA